MGKGELTLTLDSNTSVKQSQHDNGKLMPLLLHQLLMPTRLVTLTPHQIDKSGRQGCVFLHVLLRSGECQYLTLGLNNYTKSEVAC